MKWLFFIAICHPFLLFAQRDIQFKNLTVDDGLSFNLVFEIIQDKEGFIWFGTVEGLNRYDGYEFTVFKQNYGDSTSLPDNSIWALFEDESGVIWVGTDGGGLSRFNKETETFHTFKHKDSAANSLSHNSVNAILEDSKGNLWIATYGGGLNLMDRESETFKRFLYTDEDDTSLSNNYVHFLFEDKAGSLWIGTNQGLNKYNYSDSSFISFGISEGFVNENILAIAEHNGLLWLGTWGGGLMAFDQNSQTILTNTQDRDLSNSKIAAVYEDNSANLWVGFLGTGLSLIGNERTTYSYDPLNQKSIVNNNIWFIYQDSQSNLWIGTESGVSQIMGGRKPFVAVSKSQGFSEEQIYDFEKDQNGRYWVATDQGLFFSDDLKGRFEKFPLKDAPENTDIWSITLENEDFLWVTTYGSGVYRISLKSEGYSQRQFKNRIQDTTSISSENVSCILQSNDGTIWIGTYGEGLNKFDEQTNSFEHWYKEGDARKSLAGNNLLALAEDSYGFLWVGTYSAGLTKLNKEDGTTVSYNRENSDLAHNTILCVFEDRNKELWVGTDGGGLGKYIRESNTFEIYSGKKLLPSNTIHAIEEDSNGHLWLSTSQGLVKFNPVTTTTRVYTKSDGLISNAFNSGSSFKDDDGTLFFGVGGGFSYFHPSQIEDSDFDPPTYITELKILNQIIEPSDSSVLSRDIKHTDDIVLTHNDRVFSFEFVALDYTSPKKIKYAYKLVGFDDDWVQTDANNRIATYTNLDVGEYQFQVKATNSDGVWNKKPTTLGVTILPPPWLTWWAYTIYVFLLISILILIIRAFIIRERLKATIKLEKMEVVKMQELDQLKTRFFTNISHEFRTPLTLILTPIGNLIELSNDIQVKNTLLIIKRNARRLLSLINELLDLSKLEAGHLKLVIEQVAAQSFFKIIIASFNSLAESKDIRFITNIECGASEVYFDKDKMEKIVNNLLSNAIKFTPNNGEVSFLAKVENDTLKILTKNSGIVISKEDQQKVFERFYQTTDSKQGVGGTGVGLALVKELVELHKGVLTLSRVKTPLWS